MGKVFSSAEEALPHIGELNGIVIVDIKLPGMNGARLVAEISQGNKNVQCIICSMYDDDEFIFSALKNGALGYLLKDSSGDQILAALEGLTKGGSPMSPYIARRVIASFQQRQEKKVTDLLSEREHEVLQQLSQGLIYKEIGEKLFISHETVKQHIKHIYQKLHVQNKVEALNKLRSN
jgi:DNA-binding NarL/FixJ family response regulator